MPLPVSITVSVTSPARRRRRTSTRPPPGVNLIAFERRFETTCRSRSPVALHLARAGIEDAHELDPLGFRRGRAASVAPSTTPASSRAAPEPELPRDDARHVEQILDQLGLRPSVPLDDVERSGGHPARTAPPQHAGPGEDRRERCPELVRHHREKLVLGAIRALGLQAGVLCLAIEPGHVEGEPPPGGRGPLPPRDRPPRSAPGLGPTKESPPSIRPRARSGTTMLERGLAGGASPGARRRRGRSRGRHRKFPRPGPDSPVCKAVRSKDGASDCGPRLFRSAEPARPSPDRRAPPPPAGAIHPSGGAPRHTSRRERDGQVNHASRAWLRSRASRRASGVASARKPARRSAARASRYSAHYLLPAPRAGELLGERQVRTLVPPARLRRPRA